MNALHFFCTDCKVYLDAGYRWAYRELEDKGIVSRHQRVDISKVIAAAEYWNPPVEDKSRWLYDEIFPTLRAFLRDHAVHHIEFGETYDYFDIDSDEYFEWMEIGYLSEPTPRSLVELLQLKSWDAAVQYLDALELKPWWWLYGGNGDSSLRDRAQRKVNQLLLVARPKG